jgi:hypothetical protein
MITRRSTDLTWIASLYDEAIMDVPSERLQVYIRTRRLADAGIDQDGKIEDTGRLVTLFRVRPLKRELVHLLDDNGAVCDRVLFSAHVEAIKNAEGIDFGRDPSGAVRADIIDAIGTDVVHDVALYIRDQARGMNGSSLPFSSPAGYRIVETRLRMLRALSA